MESELQKLRIDKSRKARRDERSAWPWILIVVLIVAGGGGLWQWRSASAAPSVQTIRVRVPDAAATQADQVILNATGYVIAAHRIDLASRVMGRVSWIGVEMGDKITKD